MNNTFNLNNLKDQIYISFINLKLNISIFNFPLKRINTIVRYYL